VTGLEEAISDYLVGLAVRGYSTETLRGRRHHLASFSAFAANLE
jgi:hypothetical protein